MQGLVRLSAVVGTLSAAVLLFLVEPMVARMVLPLLGGTPAVWNTCMFFFQAVLLAGYAYAHALSRIRPGARVLLHTLVLVGSLWFLPLHLALRSTPPMDRPVPWLLGVLAASIGVPFFALSATGPLVQKWLHDSALPEGSDPYPLYAWGNAGSLGALLGYPLLIEPWLPLGTQAAFWSAGFLAFVPVLLLCGTLAWKRARIELAPPRAEAPPVATATRAFWVLLAFVPSATFLAVTHYMSTDVAVFPLLWVLPLAIYLLTLILAFSKRSLPHGASSLGLAVSAALVVASFWAFRRPYTWVLFLLHPLTLFFVGWVCHGRLARSRPEPARLTEFYLLLALGGALGGCFATFVAPACFDSIAEYPLLLVLACLLRPGLGQGSRRSRFLDLALPVLLAAMVALTATAVQIAGVKDDVVLLLLEVAPPCALVLLFVKRPLRFALGIALLLAAVQFETAPGGALLHARRDFFGVHKVVEALGPGIEGVDTSGNRVSTGVPFHFLYDGTTRHGGQALGEPLRHQPTSYFSPTGPLGEVFAAFPEAGRLDRIAVVGLGAGTIAAYGRPGRSIAFFEIDPEVVRIARDERLFTYLRDSAGETSVATGDGRTLLAALPDASYDLIVLDAFASDAIPIHLMTEEAIALYFRKLGPQGLLAAHITNQHLDLEPVFHSIAADLGLVGRSKFDEVESIHELEQGKDRSHWVVLARDEGALGALAQDADWLRVPLHSGAPTDRRFLWKDDYSSVLRGPADLVGSISGYVRSG